MPLSLRCCVQCAIVIKVLYAVGLFYLVVMYMAMGRCENPLSTWSGSEGVTERGSERMSGRVSGSVRMRV